MPGAATPLTTPRPRQANPYAGLVPYREPDPTSSGGDRLYYDNQYMLAFQGSAVRAEGDEASTEAGAGQQQQLHVEEGQGHPGSRPDGNGLQRLEMDACGQVQGEEARGQNDWDGQQTQPQHPQSQEEKAKKDVTEAGRASPPDV